MKKLLVSICLVVLSLSIACGALAWETPYSADWVTIYGIQCVNTTTLKYMEIDDTSGYSNCPYKEEPDHNPYGITESTAGRIYVRHTVINGGSNEFTNLFHAVRCTDASGEVTYESLVAQKWVTPNMWIPIQGSTSAISVNHHYVVAVRGNTKHYEYYGTTSVDFYIGIEANQ